MTPRAASPVPPSNTGHESTSTTKNMVVFPADLLLDIARLIFEKAIEDDPIPVQLVLVSRQVQHWVEPLIYRHLSFRTHEKFKLFYRTFHDRQTSLTKPPDFYSRNVRTLCICFEEPEEDKLCTIGEALTGLRAIAAWPTAWVDWGNAALRFMKKMDAAQSCSISRKSEDGARDTGELSTYPYRDLRKLSLSTESLCAQELTFDHRMFRNLTHLDTYFTFYFDWSSLVSLYNLTHLSVDMATTTDPDLTMVEMTMWMETITTFCEHLDMIRVISFACVSDDHVDFDLLDDEENYLLPPDLDILSKPTGSITGPLCSLDIDERCLHPWTRMAIGMYHPLVVIGTLTQDLPKDHLLREYLVLFEWPQNVWDWDFSVPAEKHKESWEFAEDIINKRRKDKERANGILGLKEILRQQRGGNDSEAPFDD